MPASRRKQTRLTFTPLPSSSPATKGYHKQIQDRAAAVGYDGPATKRRKLQQPASDKGSLGNAQMDGVNDELPTPAATTDKDGDSIDDDEAEESEPILSSQRRPSAREKLNARKRSRQQQLDFSSGRDPDSFSSPVKLSSPSRPQSSAQAGMFGTQKRRSKRQQPLVDISSDESDGEELPSPAQLTAEPKEKVKSREAARSSAISQVRGRATRGSQRPVVVDSDDEEEDADDTIMVSSKAQPEAGEEADSGDEEDMPTTQGKLPRRKRQRSRDSFISSSPPRAVESDSDVEIVEKPRRGRGGTQDMEEEGDEDDVPVTPSRRKLKRPRKLTREEQDDLNEDLDFLGPSSDVEALERQPVSTQSKQKSARQAALEKLKRKRSGQHRPAEEAEQEDNDNAAEDFDEMYDDSDDAPTPQPTSSRQMFRKEEEDEDFIDEEEEDGGLLGVPDGMPIQFTKYGSMKAKELFKFAIEWFVQKKVNPAFNMHDELYDLTFKKLDDEVQGLAGSKFRSAAWTPQFTIALKSRPEIAFEPIDRREEEHWMRGKCDACNRSGHPATYQIQFQGKPYHPHTLEEVGAKAEEDEDEHESSSSDDDENDEDDDSPAYDYHGTQVAPANTIYYVGKFCMANAETAHALQHWRYHLNAWVVMYLISHKHMTDEKIVKREKQSSRKRKREANKITDRMEKDGVIKELWQEFRKNIDEARSSKQGRYSSADD